jgi:selenocysteine lyase/cysteine desulfurase
LGFLYVRRDRQTQLDPDSFGYRQLSTFSANPDDRPPVRWQRRDDAAGLFMVGTPANGVVALLEHSLGYIHAIGVEAIAAHRAPLLAQLRAGLDELNVPILTPPSEGTPILAFAPAEAARAAAAFKAANIFASFDNNRFRVAPSLYNDATDIERLLEALAGV